ncbi:MAG TPA: signal recognition particle protein [Thermoanaerobaculia bacterium]|nr:signal recognition particle protein [Thermoanaerobaculia bacterium]HXK69110.1 signal recognition particle protein [Thermoanaerobaculia bacterium]
MFDQLTEKLQKVFRTLHGEGHLSEFQVDKGLKELRMVLLGADIHFSVVKDLMERIRLQAVGESVLKSLTPAQQIIKIVRDEMIQTLGEQAPLVLKGQPTVLLLAGLQGSGKTTTCAKLAFSLKRQGKRVFLVPADIRRPAAREQLITLARGIQVDVWDTRVDNVGELADRTLKHAKTMAYDVVIYDTAGRLHVDPEMMSELVDLVNRVHPHEVLYVADAMTGQDAVRSAGEFHRTVPLTGIILTKMDGDARGGAALSVRSVTGVPVKFMGVGEKPTDFETFDPIRLTGRILGMGDTLSLIERAESAIEEDEAEEMARRLKKQQFTLEDVKKQLKMIKKMGSLSDILGSLPVGGPFKALKNANLDDRAMVRVEAIIDSMTPLERERPDILNASRKRRIASGSGTTVQDINRLIKQYRQMKDMMRRFGKNLVF